MAQFSWTLTAAALLVAASLTATGLPTLAGWSRGQEGRNGQTGGADRDDRHHDPERYLFVCAGDQARVAPDFLAVIDFDVTSPNYGHVITTEPFPSASASGNEPHHIGLSRDGRTVACGGLLSVLKSQDEVFFFDVSTPSSPRFITSANPPLSSITDEFYALPHGGFLVTMMGGPSGHA
ncbi:MAG TPA: hypothetical protein VKE51_24580, partial [Vicinamibacterales bacterium]|nr:hypothetical protein [Vicinamibacterales bacterium]